MIFFPMYLKYPCNFSKHLKQCFFCGKLLPNFNLKNIISTYTKEFPWKKSPKFAKFQKK